MGRGRTATLQSAVNPKPVADADIDLGQLADWHEFCARHRLHYNRVLDQTGTTLRDALTEIAAAGRATPRHDGMQWGVVIDRPSDLIIDHIGPRNSWNFSISRSYAEQPHALIVKFQDQTRDYKEDQRVIRRPGYNGPIDLTEVLDLPGITDPEIVYREALRRFYEAQYRPDVFEVTQDGAARVATRGDMAALSHNVLSEVQRVARVRSVSGNLIELDEQVLIEAGPSYGVRFRVYADSEDAIGNSIVRMVSATPGRTETLTLTGEGDQPLVGDLIYFGVAGQETEQVIVTRIERTEDMCQILRCVAAAPEIDILTGAAEIPAWSGRVGVEIDQSQLRPAPPRFVEIVSGAAGTGHPGQIDYLIEPGLGTVHVAAFEINYRLQGEPNWTALTIPAANGGGSMMGFATGQTVQIRARAVSAAGQSGPWTGIIPIVVGGGDAGVPLALDEGAITITALPGAALVQFEIGADQNIRSVQLYACRRFSGRFRSKLRRRFVRDQRPGPGPKICMSSGGFDASDP